MKKLIFLIAAAFYSFTTIAQGVLDGVYIKEHTIERKVIPYAHLREADVMWSKRVWRKMDLREKINQPLYFPTERIQNRRCLMQVLFDGIQEGTITPYQDENGDCEFKVMMTKAEAMAKLNPPPETTMVENPDNPEELIQKIIPKDFKAGDYKKFYMKEDWFFDKQRSVMDVRIVGIAPIVTRYADDGSEKGIAIPFWVYYPECRFVFANVEVYNRANDSERRTLEDIFWKRMFGSFIYKESNVYDRQIDEYAQGIDALLESERIKDDLFTIEHDVWEF